jgi:hypothetical protein
MLNSGVSGEDGEEVSAVADFADYEPLTLEKYNIQAK